jgi:hypothetical protein
MKRHATLLRLAVNDIHCILQLTKLVREEKLKREKAEAALKELQLRTEVGSQFLSLSLSTLNDSVPSITSIFYAHQETGTKTKETSWIAQILPFVIVAILAFLIGRLMR